VFTVCDTAADALPLKFPSPAYDAINDMAPTVAGVTVHCPVATGAVQAATPLALTVTAPLGVPAAGATGSTIHVTTYGCPAAVGVARAEALAIAMVVLPGFTVWDTAPDEPALLLASPAYDAASEMVPAAVGVTLHFPAVASAVHPATPLALTVTLPVGAMAVSVQSTSKGCPVTEGDARAEAFVIEMDAVPGFTWCVTLADELPAKFASPEYDAASVCVPMAAGVTLHCPAATGAVQPRLPLALTVTAPVGVPAAGATGSTDHCTV